MRRELSADLDRELHGQPHGGAAPVAREAPKPSPSRRPLLKRVIQLIRRGHLYLGLFLFPWAVLYGVTAFLFNHPTAFSDQPTQTFSQGQLAGTPLEAVPTPNEQADQVVRLLNEKQKPTKPYARSGDASYTRDFAFATVKGSGGSTSVLIDIKNGNGGTLRASPPEQPRKAPEKAPFAVGRSPEAAPRGGRGGGGPRPEMGAATETIKLEQPLAERVKAAVPTLLERLQWEAGDVTVTSVPDLTFPIDVDGQAWVATYNSMTGAVAGKKPDTEEKPELSVRRFLLRLHVAHGYPGETNARWFWAVIVDAMAGVMCFWGLSGLIMWWQIKATRRAGLVVLVLSAIAASALGFAMHNALTG